MNPPLPDPNNLQERNKQVDDALNKARELGEQWKNRLTLDNLRLVERYLKGDLEVLVHIRQQLASGESPEFCAVLKYPIASAGVFNARSTEGHCVTSRIGQGNASIRDIARDQEQDLVLVDVVKFVENPQAFVPTLIRLDTLDNTYRTRIHSLYFSLKGFFLFGRSRTSLTSGEVGSLPALSSSSLDQLPSQMVKAAPQMMDSLARDQAEFKRGCGVDADFIHALGFLRIYLDNESIRVGFAEGLHPAFKLTDALFGPFDFRSDAS